MCETPFWPGRTTEGWLDNINWCSISTTRRKGSNYIKWRLRCHHIWFIYFSTIVLIYVIITLRFLTPQKWLFWGPQNTPAIQVHKPFHWRVQRFLGYDVMQYNICYIFCYPYPESIQQAEPLKIIEKPKDEGRVAVRSLSFWRKMAWD